MANYVFNDWPFNAMSWLKANETIEAYFNTGNPRPGDVIEYGAQNFRVKKVDTQRDYTVLHVERVNVR